MAQGTRNAEAWEQHQDEAGAENLLSDEEIDEIEEGLEAQHFTPKLAVGDVCCLTEDVERPFGTIPEGVEVELKSTYHKKGLMWFKVETLGCGSCPLILKFDVPSDILEDYEVLHPAVAD